VLAVVVKKSMGNGDCLSLVYEPFYTPQNHALSRNDGIVNSRRKHTTKDGASAFELETGRSGTRRLSNGGVYRVGAMAHAHRHVFFRYSRVRRVA
jgi:hypothetical protein